MECGLDGSIVVMPRPGTISPWSSKATDVARLCVHGIEIGPALERVPRMPAILRLKSVDFSH